MNVMRVRLAILGLLGLALAACGDAGSGDDGGGKGLDAWELTLHVSPAQSTYLPGELVKVELEIRDDRGVLVVTPLPTVWSAVGAKAEGEGAFRLESSENLATITACLEGEGAPCVTAELPVDRSPPTLVVERPAPGDHLVSADTDGHIVVEGVITDTNPAARLAVYVNGTRATIEADGRFSLALPAEFGITHLVVEGTDGFHPPVSRRMDVLLADGYLPPVEGTTRFELEDAMIFRLSQRFFDEILGGTALEGGVTPNVAQDLASILELIVMHLDLSSLFGTEPIVDVEDVFQLRIVAVHVGDAVADLSILQHQGLRLSLNVNDVFIEMSGFLELLGERFDIAGGVKTDIRGDLRLELSTDESGDIAANVVVEDFGIASIHPMFTGSDGSFFNEFIDLPTIQMTFAELVDQQIGGEVVAELVSVIPEVLTDLLNTIGSIFDGLELELPLPPELGDPLTVRLDSRTSELALFAGASTGRLDVTIDVAVETLAEPVHGDAMGLPQADVMPMPPFSSALDIQIGIRQDFVNGLLHSLWNAGLLDVSVEVGGMVATVTPRLPPVIRMAPLNTTCRVDGVRCDAIVQLGQVEVTALGAVSAVHLEVGATLDFRDGAISLKLEQEPVITLWEVERTAASSLLNTFLLQFLESDILPALTSLVGEELLIELPLPDAAALGLGELAPELAEASLEIDTVGRIDASSGYLGLGANMRFVVP